MSVVRSGDAVNHDVQFGGVSPLTKSAVTATDPTLAATVANSSLHDGNSPRASCGVLIANSMHCTRNHRAKKRRRRIMHMNDFNAVEHILEEG
jgi:hypothetical protein